jgi:transaldolase
MANPLIRLQQLGQSPWHDNIRRQLLTSGALKKMVEDGDITGLTSNPTIFEQAIADSTDYDEDLHRLAREGKTAEEIFDALAIDDIRNAAHVLATVFERTERRDGYVSIEVAPRLAGDTQATIREARRLWSAVNRPNLMVKIPATAAGVPAIEQSIADGLNINVTLIFSLKRYEEVMDAYLRGLIRRLESGQKIDRIASVASFFVSRVDTLVDKLLDERIAAGAERKDLLQSLKGKAAIANAKLAYAEFRRKFSTEAFAGLKNHGAGLQRPLWASTSTKNPAYPDVYYVEALVGSDTVDTMPPATLVAYKDHGNPEPRLERDLDDARRVMDQLAEAGISMDAVTKKLEEDGVASFAKSFDSLIAVVERRRLQTLAGAAPPVAAPQEPRRRPTPTRRTAAARRKPTKRAAGKKSTAKKPRKAAAKKRARGAASKRRSIVKARRKPARAARKPAAKGKKRR